MMMMMNNSSSSSSNNHHHHFCQCCLISILEAIRERCFAMEDRLGRRRAEWVVKSVVAGDTIVQTILRSWVDGVVCEFSGGEADVLCMARILLELFVVEVRGMKKRLNYSGIRRFFLGWVHRCILKLGVGTVVSSSSSGGGDPEIVLASL